MVKAESFGRFLAFGIATAAVAVCSAMPVQAQSGSENGSEITLSNSDQTAVQDATERKLHARQANTPAGKARITELASSRGTHKALTPAVTHSPVESSTRYLGDLSNQGGAVLEYAQSHPVYLYSKSAKCTTPACWGTPGTFLQNLGLSDFIHVVDQYTSNTAPGRYTLGSSFFVHLKAASPTAPLTDADMAGFAHAAAAKGQSGYGHIYHIFLPPGQNVCFDATGGACYSPDNYGTFSFCGYHGSADFSDVGHVLYTVEPYQNVAGCAVESGTPNGELVDSTANVLSHEIFETITDPDSNAWKNTGTLALEGEEIGDECEFILNGVFDVPTFLIGDKKYAVQREYSNHKHGCAEQP